MRIDITKLTRESYKYLFWTVDASDLGLAPGFFPDFVDIEDAAIGEHRLRLSGVQFDGTHVYRNGDENIALRIFND